MENLDNLFDTILEINSNKINNSIFVQLPAYRDPELPKTLDSLFKNCKYPENVHAGICHQYEPNDEYINDLNKYKNHPNVKIIDILYSKSKGLCWARNLINETLYMGEKYYLQLDSHHRFAKDWDVELIEMLHSLNDPMALLTGYPYSYFPEKEKENQEYKPDKNTLENIPFNFVTTTNHISIRPEHVYNVNAPIKARCVAGGFIFTFGHFVTTCPHDPYIFFSEEVPLSVRAYTYGYNLYHPHRQYVFHEYTRDDKPKIWDDLGEWTKIQPDSHNRTSCLLFGTPKIDLGKYGLGNVRTLEDYEHYSGIYFNKRKIHPYTLQKKQPPLYDLNKLKKVSKFEYSATIPLKQIHEKIETLNDKTIEYVDLSILSENETEIYRETITTHLDKSHYCVCFETDEVPRKYFLILFFKNEYHFYLFEQILGTYDEK